MPSYEKNASSGLWSCRFRAMGEDKMIHNMRLSGFKTKQAARFAYEDWIAEAERRRTKSLSEPSAPDPNEITVADLCRMYLEYQKTRIRESTYITMGSKANKRVIPFFENVKISQATPIIIQKWMTQIALFSYVYQKDLYQILCASCRYGVDYLNTADFMGKIKPPRNIQRRKEIHVWSPEQFASAMGQEQNEEYRVFFTFLFLTGCRKGEALALSWNDIDLHARCVKISKSVTLKTGIGAYAVTEPKNESSNRTISIPESLVTILKKYKNGRSDHPFVFGGDRPFPEENLRRHLQQDAQAAELQPIRIHDLRHCHASMLISAGVPITAISKRLGHATIEQTLNTYSHMMPSDEYLLNNALNAIKINR